MLKGLDFTFINKHRFNKLSPNVSLTTQVTHLASEKHSPIKEVSVSLCLNKFWLDRPKNLSYSFGIPFILQLFVDWQHFDIKQSFLSNHPSIAGKPDTLHEHWIWKEVKTQPTLIQRKISLTHSFYVSTRLEKCSVVITNGPIQRTLPRWHLHQCFTGTR